MFSKKYTSYELCNCTRNPNFNRFEADFNYISLQYILISLNIKSECFLQFQLGIFLIRANQKSWDWNVLRKIEPQFFVKKMRPYEL